jgi:phosphate uptake regulator
VLDQGSLRFEWLVRCFDGTELPLDIVATAVPFDGRTLLSLVAEDAQLSSIFEQVDAALAEALEVFSAFDNLRAEKLRSQMEPLAQSARDILEKLSDAVGKNPERSGFYVSLIIMARSLEQIIYLIESITEDIIYVAEARDIRHAENRLAVKKDQ